MGRVKISKRVRPIKRSNPFLNRADDVTYFSSGCKLLDLVLGGGWAVGRVINIVGDKSVGKTLLAIEAAANFRMAFPNSKIAYRETETAFDESYAASLGMPIDTIDFLHSSADDTVETLEKDVLDFIDRKSSKEPGLFVLDSLDALSDKAEKTSMLSDSSYGTSKAKQLSMFFRKNNSAISNSKITFMIVSQIRDKLNVQFGKQSQRAGGRALDFYASQVLWLYLKKRIKQERRKIKRVVGVEIRAICEKNKVGLPFRECEFDLMFGYGVNDIKAGINFLKDIGKLSDLEGWDDRNAGSKIRELQDRGPKAVNLFREELNELLEGYWVAIENDFAPKHGKYF